MLSSTVLLKILFKLVRKHGMPLVLQGLIELARSDKKDKRMQVLADDLETALERYKSKNSVVSKKNIGGWIPATPSNVVIGSRVRCVFNDYSYSNFFHKEGTITEVSINLGACYIKWDDKYLGDSICNGTCWCISALEVLDAP